MNLSTDKRNLGSYELFQLAKYGNILPVRPALSPEPELEEGQQAADDFTNWMEDEAEKQNHEHE